MRLSRPLQRNVQSRVAWSVHAGTLLLALLSLSACQKLFDNTCAEDNKDCLGGGTLRSGKLCVRDGDCALGLTCVDYACQYNQSVKDKETCVTTAECVEGDYCSPTDVVCRPITAENDVGEECATSAECKKGLVCDADVNEILSKGPFGLLKDSCRAEVNDADTKPECSLPRRCTERGTVDRGGHCKSSHDCLAGLYCVPDIIDLRQSVCFGGEKLPLEPISLPLWGGGRCPADDDKNLAYFEVPRGGDSDHDFYRLPFPNDIRRSAKGIDMSGHPAPPDDLSPQTAVRYMQESAKLDGFGTNPVVFFRFSKAMKNSDLSLKTLRIVDITPDSPEYGVEASIAWGPTKKRSNYICPNWVGIHRLVGEPLRPSTTYAALITDGVHTDDDNETFERSPDFDSMLKDSAPSDGVLKSAWEKYAPLRAYLKNGARDISASQLLNAAVFTTQAVNDTVAQLRAAVEDDGVPKLGDDGLTVCDENVTSPCEDAEGRGACHSAKNKPFTELHGRVSLPIFQTGTAPYETPDQGGEIILDANGKVKVGPHAKVCIGISVPKTPPPPEGYPVLLVAHTTGGSFADQFGSAGFATWAATLSVPSVVMSIDLPVHGDRRGSVTRPPQDLYFNLLNPKAARGNALQGAADLMSLAHLTAQTLSKSDTGFKSDIPFDTKRVALWGHAQGASHAALMIGGEPRVRSAVLAGLAGHITSQLLNLKRPTDTSSILPFLLFDPDNKAKLAGTETDSPTASNPMLSIMQSYLDASDPVNFAYQVKIDPPSTAPDGHDVFMVYGLYDSFTPETSQRAYADAGALKLVRPDNISFPDVREIASPASGNEKPGNVARTVALRTYDPKDDADSIKDALEDGHLVAINSRRAVMDINRFLEMALSGETPQIGAD